MEGRKYFLKTPQEFSFRSVNKPVAWPLFTADRFFDDAPSEDS